MRDVSLLLQVRSCVSMGMRGLSIRDRKGRSDMDLSSGYTYVVLDRASTDDASNGNGSP